MVTAIFVLEKATFVKNAVWGKQVAMRDDVSDAGRIKMVNVCEYLDFRSMTFPLIIQMPFSPQDSLFFLTAAQVALATAMVIGVSALATLMYKTFRGRSRYV